jgi:subtilase family serine protease
MGRPAQGHHTILKTVLLGTIKMQSFFKVRFFLLVLSTLALALVLAVPSRADTSGAGRNVSLWVGSAEKVASAQDSERVPITVFLSFKNPSVLKNLIAELSNPRSAQYGKYLTPAQFRAQFAPDAADVARVQRTLKQLGFIVGHTPDSGLFVEATGTVGQIKANFGVSQELYAYKGKILRANAETPRIPAQIADVVSYVAGLDETSQLRQPNHVRLTERSAAIASATAGPDAPPPPQGNINSPVCSTYWGDHAATLSTAPAPYPQTLPWLICGYTPQQLRAAYGSNQVAQDGTGVRVAIVDVYASPTIVQDANRYSANHGLPKLTSSNFQQVVPPGLFNVKANDPCGPQGWYEEETLDVESVHSMAPGAFILFGGITCTDPGNAALYGFIDNRSADIVTNSYGYNGEALPADFIASENQFFMQAAAEGMSILFSSGDDGDVAALNGIASGSWEATSPYVTAVGGTSLALTDTLGDKREWGWGTYRASLNNAMVAANGKKITTTGLALPFAFYAGSGGGPSLVMLAPDYQINVPYSLSGFTQLADGTVVPLEAPHRVTPDISMVGDPYTGFLYGETYTITGDPILDEGCTPISKVHEYCEESIGGTSLSSPLFAGVLALVNQARFAHHRKAVGLVNPALYILNAGPPGSSSPIIKVNKPQVPTALLRGYLGDPTRVRVVTMNSTLSATDPSMVIEGADSSLRTTGIYDNVTGLGTPYVPALIQAFEIF